MKKYTIEIKWGAIFSIAMILWMILEKSVGLHDVHIDKHPIYTNLFAIVAIIIYILAIKDKKKNFFNNNMDWKQGFVSGIYVTIVVALFSPLVQYIISTFITPDFFKNAINYAVEHKKLTQTQAEAYFNLKSYMMQSVFGALSMGVVTAAIVAYFNKTK